MLNYYPHYTMVLGVRDMEIIIEALKTQMEKLQSENTVSKDLADTVYELNYINSICVRDNNDKLIGFIREE